MPQRNKNKRIQPLLCLGLLFVAIVVAVLLLYGGSSFHGHRYVQTLLLFLSMLLIFYASHPLAHYLFAKAYGVNTLYFFIGRSDFRKIMKNTPLASSLAKILVTIGTKLDPVRMRTINSRKRGLVFGSGAIVSTVLIVVPLFYAVLAGFSLLALALGTALFVVTLLTELLISTKVGDLSKMKREFASRRPKI